MGILSLVLAARDGGRRIREVARPVRAYASIDTPEIIAGQVDMLPSERNEVGKQRIRHRIALTVEGSSAHWASNEAA